MPAVYLQCSDCLWPMCACPSHALCKAAALVRRVQSDLAMALDEAAEMLLQFLESQVQQPDSLEGHLSLAATRCLGRWVQSLPLRIQADSIHEACCGLMASHMWQNSPDGLQRLGRACTIVSQAWSAVMSGTSCVLLACHPPIGARTLPLSMHLSQLGCSLS